MNLGNAAGYWTNKEKEDNYAYYRALLGCTDYFQKREH